MRKTEACEHNSLKNKNKKHTWCEYNVLMHVLELTPWPNLKMS